MTRSKCPWERPLWLAALLCLLLTACASRPPLPERLPTLTLPRQLHVEREQAGQRQDWLLVIQREDTRLRWSLLDLLGIPQARQLLDGDQWQADGLLPPNPAARELFAAVLFALTPREQLRPLYPQATEQGPQRALGDRWQVSYRADDSFTLNLGQGLRYEVSPLPSENAP
ncbi:hypothetical protein P0Y43_25465 [Pseudomonas entomophila]|uniref:hypothetical protein n=1 Tax=Pseudomonas entomophila TaxID=312306 RepID=UPI0023D7E8D8|nr:hypothetical protein [Pseudomonas entomophila]MDF0734035.1 hypothetical protein [Pseudomonas entomophila]